MLRKFGELFKNVPRVTVTVKGKWEPFLGFWTIQYDFVPNRKSWDAARIRMFR